MSQDVEVTFDRCRRELIAYARHVVVRPEIAEEIVQQVAVSLLEADRPPTDPGALRAWLFRVTTNLALDHLRRHSTWRETVLIETRERAGGDADFRAESRALRGNPEMSAIANEHLTVCFSCTRRNLPPPQAVSLLLVEVYGFSWTRSRG